MYAYIPQAVKINPDKKVPMVLFMCGTRCDPVDNLIQSGWVAQAESEGFIVISPDCNNYATYSETGFLIEAVEYMEEHYPVDTGRVYSTGFSNGGAASVALTRDYPQYFAYNGMTPACIYASWAISSNVRVLSRLSSLWQAKTQCIFSGQSKGIQANSPRWSFANPGARLTALPAATWANAVSRLWAFNMVIFPCRIIRCWMGDISDGESPPTKNVRPSKSCSVTISAFARGSSCLVIR